MNKKTPVPLHIIEKLEELADLVNEHYRQTGTMIFIDCNWMIENHRLWQRKKIKPIT